jgi:hypothetical protein
LQHERGLRFAGMRRAQLRVREQPVLGPLPRQQRERRRLRRPHLPLMRGRPALLDQLRLPERSRVQREQRLSVNFVRSGPACGYFGVIFTIVAAVKRGGMRLALSVIASSVPS